MGFSDGCSGGYADVSSSTYEEFVGNGATLVFKLTNKASNVTKVENWVGGVTNAYAEKTETTHWTHNLPVNDFVSVTYEAGNAPIASVAQVDVLTCDTLANTVDRDFFVLTSKIGTKFGVYLDKTGSSIAPTSAKYTECDYKVKANVSGATTAADIATIVKAAFDSLTGFTGKCTIADTGVLTFTQAVAGDCASPTDYALASIVTGSASGAYAWTQTTVGKTVTCKITYSQSAGQLQNGCTDGM